MAVKKPIVYKEYKCTLQNGKIVLQNALSESHATTLTEKKYKPLICLSAYEIKN